MLTRWRTSLLTLAFLLAAAVLLCDAVRLSPPARLVPLWVLPPTLALLGAQLALDLAGARLRKTGRLFAGEPIVPPGIVEGMPGADQPAAPSARAEAIVLGWLLALPAMVLLLSPAVGLPLYALGYLRWKARQRWVVAACVAVVIWAVLHAVFARAFGARFYSGWLLDVL